MPLQTAHLAMSGLGVIGYQSPTGLGAIVADGIHLRWAFHHQRGFPWHGYYLFRRPHQPTRSVCLNVTDFREAVSPPTKTAVMRLGILHSDSELALATVSGLDGLDLSRGTFVRLRLYPAAPAHAVAITVAFAEAAKLRCRALDDGAVVAEDVLVASGPMTSTLELAADRISVVEIDAAPAVLLMLCASPLSVDIQGGWTAVPKFQYPMCLPVAHADYPCPSKPSDAAAAQTLALDRISYGNPADFSEEFPSMHSTLEDLVVGGPPPAGEAMYLRTREVPVDDSVEGAPDAQQQHPLSMALLTTVHPAFAQMLGLYFLDTTTQEGAAFDYVILADHTGVLGGTAQTALDWLAANHSFNAVDAWICFKLVRKATPQLQPPSGVRAFSVPGVRTLDEALTQGSRTHVGLDWSLNQAPSGALMAGSPVLYHVWRVDFGADEPAAPAAEDEYHAITKDSPVLVTMTPGAPDPERPSSWPPFRIHKIDRQVSEGWNSYRVSGIDLFGRHSALSAPAQWFQWAPEPQPAPWYYEQPSGTRAIHPFAIRTLDKTPPPPPSDVVATALDPLDPFVVRDGVYEGWYDQLSEGERAQLVGLRVRWRWPRTHMDHAPGTREFRIYLQPTSTLPPDHALPHAWQVRRFVVGIDKHVRETEAGQEYELIIPRPSDPQRTGFEGVPSAADPVLYVHVGVTAADDRQHTPDHPKWTNTPFGGRHGNESIIVAPAKTFRVLRTPPPPPGVPPAPAPRVFASRADYHGVSYFTYRFRPAAHLTLHVYRALAQSVFDIDWASRPRPLLSAGDTAQFPDESEDPRWGLPLRQQVAQELNALNDLATGTTSKTDAMLVYGALSDDALRVLAGLAGNHQAFTQRTLEPLDPTEPDPADPNLLRYRDRRGPDTPDDYVPQPDLRAFVDALDGAGAGRYFYRSAAVDGAHNRSQLSLSTAPVYLPDVVAPRPPRGVVVRGEDRTIALRWQSSLEDDLAEYRVYRSESAREAANPGRTPPVHVIPETRPPSARPVHVTWTDSDVTPVRTVYYQITAVDVSGNESKLTPPVAARAFDDARPDPPVWNPAVVDPNTNAASLSWTSDDPELRSLVQHYAKGIGWEVVSPWLERGVFAFVDERRGPDAPHRYRLRVMDAKGRLNRTYNELSA